MAHPSTLHAGPPPAGDSVPGARELAAELHNLLDRIEPAGWSEDRARELRARVSSIQGHLAALLECAPAAGCAPALAALDSRIGEALPRDDTSSFAASAWVRFSHEVHPAYEALLRAVAPDAAGGRSLRPTNYARNVFHMIGATSVLFLLSIMPGRPWIIGAALSITIPAWIVEYLRRSRPRFNDWMMWVFGPVAHAHERFRANSASWYATAMTILAFTAPTPAAMMGVAVLGFGDPFAAIVGRRLGRTPIRDGRTLEGSLAFVAFGWAAGVAALAAFAPGVEDRVVVALVAAVFGALAELFSYGLDDNLTIPLGAALGASIVMGIGA